MATIRALVTTESVVTEVAMAVKQWVVRGCTQWVDSHDHGTIGIC